MFETCQIVGCMIYDYMMAGLMQIIFIFFFPNLSVIFCMFLVVLDIAAGVGADSVV